MLITRKYTYFRKNRVQIRKSPVSWTTAPPCSRIAGHWEWVRIRVQYVGGANSYYSVR